MSASAKVNDQHVRAALAQPEEYLISPVRHAYCGLGDACRQGGAEDPALIRCLGSDEELEGFTGQAGVSWRGKQCGDRIQKNSAVSPRGLPGP